jgi:type I restriction enzyme S subunit
MVEEGFQNTDAGIIPIDWKEKKLSKVATFDNGKAHEQFIDDKGAYVVVNSKFISTEGAVRKYSNKNLCPLRKGDIAMVMSDIPNGRALAKCFLVDKDDYYTLNQRIGCIRAGEELNTEFLYYFLNRNKYFLSFDNGAGQTNLKKSEIQDCPVAYPKSKDEQEEIASSLTSINSLIKELELLLVKKKNVHQGVIQKLTTPDENWTPKIIDDVADVVGGGTPSTSVSKYWDGNINWFSPTEIGFKKYAYSSKRKITQAGLNNSSAKLLPVGTVLLTSRATVGEVSILKTAACTNQGFQSLIPKAETHNEFLYYLMLTKKNDLIQKASGSTFLEVSPSAVRRISLMMPEHPIQVEIANILSDMDEEIEMLELTIEKQRQLRTGLIQNLLPGKIRLNK